MEINEESPIEDLVCHLPVSVRILARHGLVCIQCGEPCRGTLKELATFNGMANLDAVIEALRQAAVEHRVDAATAAQLLSCRETEKLVKREVAMLASAEEAVEAAELEEADETRTGRGPDPPTGKGGDA